MPANLTPEYYKAEERYRDADTKEEKLKALREMLAKIPKHKGTEHIQADIKAKMAKLRDQSEAKVSRHAVTVPKAGEAQICIIGLPNSGKSSLLKRLTNAEPDVERYEYTTTEPEVGMMEWRDVQIQLVEIPSTWTDELLAIARNSDGLILLINPDRDYDEQKEELETLLYNKLDHMRHCWVQLHESDDNIREKIWESLDRIRIYTKSPGKDKELPAITFPKYTTVEDVARKVHRDLLERFRFARIYGPSAKFDGQQVGLDHELSDGDVVEIHTE